MASIAVPRTVSLESFASGGLADCRVRGGLDTLVDRESGGERHRRVNIEACLRLARFRLRGIVFPRRTAVQQQVLGRIVGLLEPDRRPDLVVALRAVFGVDGSVSFKSASRFIEAEWSIRVSDHTFADLWRRMVAALSPRPAGASPASAPLSAAIGECSQPDEHCPSPGVAVLHPPAPRAVRVHMVGPAFRSRAPARNVRELHAAQDAEPPPAMLAVIVALLAERSDDSPDGPGVDAERLRSAAQRLAADLNRR